MIYKMLRRLCFKQLSKKKKCVNKWQFLGIVFIVEIWYNLDANLRENQDVEFICGGI